MNRKLLYILITIILTGCSSEDTPVNESCYVSFINGISYDITQNFSRADVFEYDFIPKDKTIGVFGFQSAWVNQQKPENVIIPEYWKDTELQPNCINAGYISMGESKALKSTNNINLEFPDTDNSALVFYGYHPYTNSTEITMDDLSRGPKIAIDVDSTMVTTKDYLYTGSVPAVPTGNRTNINLPFKHALSLVHFKVFTNDAKYSDNNCPLLTQITITTKNSQTGWMYIEDGSIGANPDAEEKRTITYKLSRPFPIYPKKDEKETYTDAKFLLIPATNAIESITLTVTDTDKETRKYIAYSQNDLDQKNNIELIKGAKHIANIEYNVRIQITNSVETWTPNEDNHDIEIN